MKYKFLLPLALTFSFPILADQPLTIDSPHTVFYGAALSDMTFSRKNETKDVDDGAANEFGYRYQINDTFAFDARYIKSSSISFKELLSLGLFDGTIDYSAIVASAQGRYAITKNIFVYGNVGASSYNWEYNKQGPLTATADQRKLDDSGLGAFGAIGAKYQWSHVELSIENKWLMMGDVKVSNFGLAVGYRF